MVAAVFWTFGQTPCKPEYRDGSNKANCPFLQYGLDDVRPRRRVAAAVETGRTWPDKLFGIRIPGLKLPRKGSLSWIATAIATAMARAIATAL